MGEAKRKYYGLRLASCLCGSGKSGQECCWTEQRWFKAPAKIDVLSTGYSGSNRRCYLRGLNSCSDRLSGEHMISATVLKQLGETTVRVSGVPWLEKDEWRTIGINSLVANCLCEAHNNALSPLDAAAGHFYRCIQEILAYEAAPYRHHIFSGHDIERWLLKITAGMAASRTLGSDGGRLPGIFAEGINVSELLQDPLRWRRPMGMYLLQKLGDKIQPKGEFGVAPLASTSKEIGGLLTQIHGFMVALVLVRPDSIKGSALDGAPYQLEKLYVNYENGRHIIELCWMERR